MKTWHPIAIALMLVLLVSARVLSQSNGNEGRQQPEQKSFTFSVKVGLVLLPVTVLDKSGDFVSGLQEKDFAVYEDGVPQSLEVFDNKDLPVVMGLMIDNSSSMAPMRSEVIAAALALAESSNPEDELFVAHFYDRVSFTLRLGEAFARNLDMLREAVSKVPGSGKTALYDAVYSGLEYSKLGSLQKKVLVIISDGADTASKHTLDEILEMAKSSNALIYSMGIYDERNKSKSPKVLKELANISGGRAFFPNTVSELPEVCRRIAIDVRSQYTLGYIPSNQNKDGRFRKIRVDVRSPNQDKLTIRTRSGYTIEK
jgi:Ca-activated chloride channel family protein